MPESDYNPFQPGEDIRRRPYPYLDYKNSNPAEGVEAAIEWRRPAFVSTDSFYLWRKYLEDDVDHEGSFGGPYTFGKIDE